MRVCSILTTTHSLPSLHPPAHFEGSYTPGTVAKKTELPCPPVPNQGIYYLIGRGKKPALLITSNTELKVQIPGKYRRNWGAFFQSAPIHRAEVPHQAWQVENTGAPSPLTPIALPQLTCRAEVPTLKQEDRRQMPLPSNQHTGSKVLSRD